MIENRFDGQPGGCAASHRNDAIHYSKLACYYPHFRETDGLTSIDMKMRLRFFNVLLINVRYKVQHGPFRDEKTRRFKVVCG